MPDAWWFTFRNVIYRDTGGGEGGEGLACGRNQRIKVPDSLECAGSDICVGALTPLIHLSQYA